MHSVYLDEASLEAAVLLEFPEYYANILEIEIKIQFHQHNLERSSFLAIGGQDLQLIVYGDRVTLTVSYETTGLFPGGYLFKSYPEFSKIKRR
ncbi:MAG: hypothetical protein EZS28_027802 [Streblomastix strix]|uniref:Uncharacterized protein n=1 Tax=Streblomastix strix TaxID=222440 RepID=A0A5J4V1R0_9EUKA|nr:MAG: hypothetical protein EZS28_027802 [Streblomastix strix]